jgi:hypothetical protein
LCCHDQDSLPVCAASTRSRSRNAKHGSSTVASYSLLHGDTSRSA